MAHMATHQITDLSDHGLDDFETCLGAFWMAANQTFPNEKAQVLGGVGYLEASPVRQFMLDQGTPGSEQHLQKPKAGRVSQSLEESARMFEQIALGAFQSSGA